MTFLDKIKPDILRAIVYGANDGIITTFAVVAGVSGAGLSANIILILGIANMIADGISMGLGDYLGERSEQKLRKHRGGKYESNGLWKSGLATIISFNVAGTLPLLPYFLLFIGLKLPTNLQLMYSTIATALALFTVGSLRTFLTKGSWWKNGLEMLGIGAIAASVAFLLGAGVESLILSAEL